MAIASYFSGGCRVIVGGGGRGDQPPRLGQKPIFLARILPKNFMKMKEIGLGGRGHTSLASSLNLPMYLYLFKTVLGKQGHVLSLLGLLYMQRVHVNITSSSEAWLVNTCATQQNSMEVPLIVLFEAFSKFCFTHRVGAKLDMKHWIISGL